MVHISNPNTNTHKIKLNKSKKCLIHRQAKDSRFTILSLTKNGRRWGGEKTNILGFEEKYATVLIAKGNVFKQRQEEA